MKSERDWRIIPVLLTALSRVRLARSAFLLFFIPHLSPFRFPRHPFSYTATRTTGSLNFISSLGYGLPRVRSASLSSPLLYPRPFRPSTALTACTTRLRPFPLGKPCSFDRLHDTQSRRYQEASKINRIYHYNK